MEGNEGVILPRSERIVARKEYIETFVRDERYGTDNNSYKSDPRIIKEVVEQTISLGKNGKAPGLNDVLVKLLKNDGR